MFRVSARFVVGEDVGELDEEVFRIAGRESDGSVAAMMEDGEMIRDHFWLVDNFADAVDMKYWLDKRAGIVTTIQEK